MADCELLSVHRARHFIQFTLENDLQVKANRSRGGVLLARSLGSENDSDLVEFPAEKFDKLMTFFNENDRQVHYQERDTVGVYAMTRLLGEMRRLLRDYTSETIGPMQVGGHDMASPRVVPRMETPRGASSSRGTRSFVPDLDLSRVTLGKASGSKPGVESKAGVVAGD